MKNSYLFIGAIAVASFGSAAFVHTAQHVKAESAGIAMDAPADKAAKSLAVNTSSSTIHWHAAKVGGTHDGTVKIASGSLEVNKQKVTGGNFVIDMASLDNTDMTNEGMKQKLVGHLKSEDFFSVEKHPTANFTITKATPIAKAKAGEPNYTVSGNLTIKGITHPISFPATISATESAAEAEAKITIDRTKWDIKYRSGLIGTAADKIIDDNFTIDLKLVAGTNI